LFGVNNITFGQNSDRSNINLQLDYIQFRGNSGATLLEIYYSIPRNAILHEETSSGFEGEYKFECRVIYQNELISNLNWSGKDVVKSMGDIRPNQTINDYHLLLLRPNSYNIEIDFLNSENEVKYTSTKEILIRNFEDNELQFSGIQLCSAIKMVDQKNRFSKNGYQLTVNPSAIFGEQWPILYYYSEIYNLNVLYENTDSTYSVESFIKGQDEQIIKELPAKNNIRLGTSLVNVGQAYVGDLRSGAYDLEMNVTDNSNGENSRIVKRFYLYRSSDFLASSRDTETKVNKLSSTFLGFSEEELDREFSFAKYIATEEEKDAYEKLNLAGKREFMVKFWTDRNEKSLDGAIDSRIQYFDRLEFANRRYSSGGKKGWQKDTGRIILVYGIPDELDKFTSQATLNQYEIWQYHQIQGGVQFVFVDNSGYGDLRLVHSTAINEIQDYQWQQRYLQQ
jgi:GWxTD domain-containing protein